MINDNYLRSLLLKQFNMYPKMQIQDMIKLIYQNEFAGGHLITNEADSLKRLQEEYRLSSQYSYAAQNSLLFEEIGEDLCRLNLALLKKYDISLNTVNRFFIKTAEAVSGNIQSFESKLEVFRQCCIDGELPYSIQEIDAYLSSYKNSGYPAVSHSETYRLAYLPAYRIINSHYMKYFDLFCKIDSLLNAKDTVNVAIDGNSGAGKSTLAALIGDIYECNVFHMDDFFLRPVLRTQERLKETGGNVDYIRFRDEVISGLLCKKEFKYRIFDCRQMALGELVTVTPRRLNIIEGSYSMHPILAKYYDLKIFLHIDEKKQSQRILKRNGEHMYKRFLNEWVPMENKYFTLMKIKEQSDLVFEG